MHTHVPRGAGHAATPLQVAPAGMPPPLLLPLLHLPLMPPLPRSGSQPLMAPSCRAPVKFVHPPSVDDAARSAPVGHRADISIPPSQWADVLRRGVLRGVWMCLSLADAGLQGSVFPHPVTRYKDKSGQHFTVQRSRDKKPQVVRQSNAVACCYSTCGTWFLGLLWYELVRGHVRGLLSKLRGSHLSLCKVEILRYPRE